MWIDHHLSELWQKGVFCETTCISGWTDNGTYRSLCDGLGARVDVHCRYEVPEVGRLAGTTSVGTWRHTLGMPPVHDDATAASRLSAEAGCSMCGPSSHVQASVTKFAFIVPLFIFVPLPFSPEALRVFRSSVHVPCVHPWCFGDIYGIRRRIFTKLLSVVQWRRGRGRGKRERGQFLL